jgi:hypothetical protein
VGDVQALRGDRRNDISAQGTTNWQVVIETSHVHSAIFVLLVGLILLGGVLAAPDAPRP